MNYWPLLGVAVVVVGFVLRLNPVIVVVSAGLVSGLPPACRCPTCWRCSAKASCPTARLLMFAFTLPVIGLLERAGLREHALRLDRAAARRDPAAPADRYLGVRQLSAWSA